MPLSQLPVKYYTENDYIKAEKYLKKAGSFENGIGLNYLGNIYLAKNENKLAEKYYKSAIDSGNTTAIKNLAYLYTMQEKLEPAKKYYNMYLLVEPNDIVSKTNLGAIYFMEKNYQLSEKYYKESIADGSETALNDLAVLYHEQKIAIEAGNIEAITNLGDCYFEQKKYRLAKEYYKMNLENENNNKKVEILNNLEEIKKMGY